MNRTRLSRARIARKSSYANEVRVIARDYSPRGVPSSRALDAASAASPDRQLPRFEAPLAISASDLPGHSFN